VAARIRASVVCGADIACAVLASARATTPRRVREAPWGVNGRVAESRRWNARDFHQDDLSSEGASVEVSSSVCLFVCGAILNVVRFCCSLYRAAARRRGGRPPVQSLATRPARERTTRHHRQMIRSDDSPAPPTLSRPAPSLCPPVNLQNYVMMYYLNSPRRATATTRAEGWLRPNDSVVVSRRVSK
jgi:hypothetical protein